MRWLRYRSFMFFKFVCFFMVFSPRVQMFWQSLLWILLIYLAKKHGGGSFPADSCIKITVFTQRICCCVYACVSLHHRDQILQTSFGVLCENWLQEQQTLNENSFFFLSCCKKGRNSSFILNCCDVDVGLYAPLVHRINTRCGRNIRHDRWSLMGDVFTEYQLLIMWHF